MEIIEIAKIIEYNAGKVIEHATPNLVEPWFYLVSELDKTDVSTNQTYQKVFCQYYHLDVDKLGDDYITNYFQQLEKYKNQVEYDIEEICVAISYAKQSDGKIHPIDYKNVSLILNLLNTQFPIWHSRFLKMLGIAQPYFLDTGKEIRYFEKALMLIQKDIEEIIRLNLLVDALQAFDEKFPSSNISTEKKLEFLFLAFDSIHFLEVLFPEEDKILDEDSLSLN